MNKTQHVDRYTRAKRNQPRKIYCPKCGIGQKVFHFSWSALVCQNCHSDVRKYDWLLNSNPSLIEEP